VIYFEIWVASMVWLFVTLLIGRAMIDRSFISYMMVFGGWILASLIGVIAVTTG
jgi:hypothetical protein